MALVAESCGKSPTSGHGPAAGFTARETAIHLDLKSMIQGLE